MPITQDHEIHRRRLGRNIGVGLTLAAFAALVFGLTIVKVSENGVVSMKGYDHSLDPDLARAADEREPPK